ncbi:MAG: hypothetical protein LCH95_00590 [Proteobacteria bacterium]|nr:hypothetical protein [Pseudomonadota bacterium]
MPITWTVDPDFESVAVLAEGAVTRADVEAYLEAIDAAGAVAWRKLIDGRGATLQMTHDDMMAVGVRLRGYHDGPVGPLAIVLSRDGADAVARILGIMAAADRPMRLFTSVRAAERWLEGMMKP